MHRHVRVRAHTHTHTHTFSILSIKSPGYDSWLHQLWAKLAVSSAKTGIIIGQTISFSSLSGQLWEAEGHLMLHKAVQMCECRGERSGHQDGTSSSGKRLGEVWRRLELK